MIKLFRTLRRRILSQSSFSKYLVYASGEIFLVMIGILLALQFNNWNSNRVNTKKEIWYLDNIASDMYYQEETLKYIDTSFTEAIKVSKDILKDYMLKKSFTKIDSLNEKLNMLMISQPFPNTDNTYQELISSGQLSLIEDQDLSTNIIDFYLLTEECEQTIMLNINHVYYKEIYPVFNKFTQVELDELELEDDELMLLNSEEHLTADILTRLKSPKESLALLNAIKTHILIITHHQDLVKLVLDEIDAMSKEIEDELVKLKK